MESAKETSTQRLRLPSMTRIMPSIGVGALVTVWQRRATGETWARPRWNSLYCTRPCTAPITSDSKTERSASLLMVEQVLKCWWSWARPSVVEPSSWMLYETLAIASTHCLPPKYSSERPTTACSGRGGRWGGARRTAPVGQRRTMYCHMFSTARTGADEATLPENWSGKR